MMMHIGKKLYRSVAVLCALVLSFSLVFSDCMVAQASTDSVDVQLPKLMDIALTAQGVVASPAVLDSVSDALVTRVRDSLDAVYNAMVSAGETTWNNVSSYISECVDDYTLQKVLNAYIKSVKDYGFMLPVVTAVDVATALSPNEHGGSGRERGKTYILEEDVIGTINKVFQEWVVECEDYYLYRVPAFSEIDTKYFYGDCYTFASNFFKARALPNEPYYIDTAYRASNYVYSGNLVLGCFENPDYYFYVDGVNNDSLAYPYYDGILGYMSKYGVYDSESIFDYNISDTDAENYSILNLVTSSDYISTSFKYKRTYASGGTALKTNYTYQGFVGQNAFVIRLYKEEDSDIDVGNQDVYYTPDYDTNMDTGVTYTGDYYCNTYNSYNYTTVQEIIDNTENIDNSIVNEIVDNSVTEIVNNYTNTEPEATATPEPTVTPVSTATPEPLVTMPPDLGDTDKDGDGEVSLTEFFQGIKDLIAWLLNTLGQIASLIADLGNGILSILNTFTGLFSGFSGLLGVMFSFIPQQLLDALTAGMSAVVLIALYNKFLGGKD